MLLRPDLQNMMDQYMEMCNMVSTLRILNAEQQQRIELEREYSKRTKNKLKSMACWLTKRENHYKMSLEKLEKENKELQRSLVEIQREHDRAELANNAKVFKLQDEIELLQIKVAQLGNEHQQQLILQNIRHKEETLKYTRLLEDLTVKSLKEQNVARKCKIKVTEKHPALDEEERQKTKKLPELEVRKVTGKKRKLFQEDNDITIDII